MGKNYIFDLCVPGRTRWWPGQLHLAARWAAVAPWLESLRLRQCTAPVRLKPHVADEELHIRI